MAKRLIKVAKELNVGTSTIVDFLEGSEDAIDNKPTSKVSDEAYRRLLQHFKADREIKAEADSMVKAPEPTATPEAAKPTVEARTSTPTTTTSNGNGAPSGIAKPKPQPRRTSILTDPTFSKPPVPEEKPKPEPKKEAPVEAKQAAPVKEEPKAEPTQAEAKPEGKAPETESRVPGLKVLGKVDLSQMQTDRRGRRKVGKKEKTKPAAKAKPTPAPKAPAAKTEPTKQESPKPEPKKEAPAEAKAQPKPEAPKTDTPKADAPATPTTETTTPTASNRPETIKAEAPELRGLKVKGKIDLSKIQGTRPKKKKEDAGGTDAGGRRRRRRIARPADARGGGNNRRGGNDKRGKSGNKKNENKEVSKKEIEDQIKATMARLSGGGGKRSRQRMRREKRDIAREKREREAEQQDNGKLNVTEFVSVQELASLMDVQASEVIMQCMNLGYFVTLNQRLDAEIIDVIAGEFGFEVEFISAEEQLEIEDVDDFEDDPDDMRPRAPIVTVMGHVDHGKTSLLDYIRSADVAADEAGGITQHIGAYEARVGEEGKKITFLDTPGHEAFTAMRARGAKVTDIAIIIIAADDAIMPQTKEAISHAAAAEVPMVFAINKVDKPGADPERIKGQLAEMNYLVEDWGGKYQSKDISAKTGQGIEDLLESVLLEAELLELQANPKRPATAVVLEASLDKGRGYVTKVLVENGTLDIGDPVVSGEFSGKIKAMFDERGKRVKSIGPAQPALIMGLDGAPQAGERFKEMDTEQEARQLAGKRAQIAREQTNRAAKRISLEEIGRRLKLGTFKELNLIIKGDFDGSVEALSDSMLKQSIETVQVNVIHKAVGQIIESDVLLASASDAIIIGFQVRPSMQARKLAEREGVEIKTYSVIYEAIDDVRNAIEGLLEPDKEERVVATVEVREVFKINRVGTIAGCYVQDGEITRNTNIRVIRDGIVVYPVKENAIGELGSLKRFKDDVREVKKGFECGLTVKGYNDIRVGDIIEGYDIVEVKRKLS